MFNSVSFGFYPNKNPNLLNLKDTFNIQNAWNHKHAPSEINILSSCVTCEVNTEQWDPDLRLETSGILEQHWGNQ